MSESSFSSSEITGLQDEKSNVTRSGLMTTDSITPLVKSHHVHGLNQASTMEERYDPISKTSYYRRVDPSPDVGVNGVQSLWQYVPATNEGPLQHTAGLCVPVKQAGLDGLSPSSRKHRPIATGVVDYFPDALAEVALVSFTGNEQHHPGAPLHWDRSKSTDEADALMRHFVQRGTRDVDGMRHSAKVAWRALALLQKELEQE